MSHEPKVRYGDEDLQEFKVLIEEKLHVAQEELNTTERQISDLNENGFNQQGGDWYDDSTAHTDLEMLQRMLTRQQRHVQDLRNAGLRIRNKTYGICSVTGQLISKERLRLVPHATKSIDGKNMANAGRENHNSDYISSSDSFPTLENDRPAGKPTSDKLRLPNTKRTTSTTNEDWEADSEPTEETSYANRNNKFDDDDEQ